MRLMDLFRKKSSGEVAKDRLKLLLVSDRANCSPELMEQIKNDIIQVISKYMDIDAQGLDIQITETAVSYTHLISVISYFSRSKSSSSSFLKKSSRSKYQAWKGMNILMPVSYTHL